MKGRPHLIPSLFAALCLLATLLDWPYGYYVFLRIVVFIAALFVIATAYKSQQFLSLGLWCIIAVLFNPIIKIPLSREVWQPIDFVCSVLFVGATIIVKLPKNFGTSDYSSTLAPNQQKIEKSNVEVKMGKINWNRGFWRVSFLIFTGILIFCAITLFDLITDKESYLYKTKKPHLVPDNQIKKPIRLSDIPEPPPGYVLEEPSVVDKKIKLPEGFILDEPINEKPRRMPLSGAIAQSQPVEKPKGDIFDKVAKSQLSLDEMATTPKVKTNRLAGLLKKPSKELDYDELALTLSFMLIGLTSPWIVFYVLQWIIRGFCCSRPLTHP